jgi:DNA polymerase
MKTTQKQKIIEALKDQQSIFGDYLFEEELPQPAKKNYKIPEVTEFIKEPEAETISLFVSEADWQKAKTLDELNNLIKNCTNCVLHKNRTNFVFGSGNPNAKVMVIGEGPGAEEDKQGLPFVGRAGQLLTDILKAIKFEREEVYIANIIKCRPPENRTPSPEEMDTCIPYLKKQISLIQPKMILCLGLTAAKGLLRKKESLTALRGKFFDYEGIKVMVTFHPAALLRNPNWKRDCWEDVKKFRKMYDEIIK